MPNATGEYGVDLSRTSTRGHMPRDIAAAHQRLASLPTTRHEQAPRVTPEMARERSEKAARTKKNRGSLTKGESISLEGSRPAKPRGKT